MHPTIKWLGGKTQLLGEIRNRMPSKFNQYWEPFLGGGAVLFDITPSNAIVNDINSELINLYRHIQQSPDVIVALTETIDRSHDLSDSPSEYYYSIRQTFNDNLETDTLEQAARFLYLNKHCFNGLYRVNKKGKFNAAFNKKVNINSCDETNIFEMSDYLKNVTLLNDDFEAVLRDVEEGDFVFIDSPYAPLSATTFTGYTKYDFKLDDHKRLARVFDELTSIGAQCMLTNHNTELIVELYASYNIECVQVARSINRNGNARKGEEVIITNY